MTVTYLRQGARREEGASRKPPPTSVRESAAAYTIARYKRSRHWAIHAPDGALVCVTLYKKGATEAARRLNDGKEDTP